MDALFNSASCVTPVLVMAALRADSISSLTLPGVGVNIVLIGLIVLSGRPFRAVLSLPSVSSTLGCVMAASVEGAAFNPLNHVPGVAVPARFATIRSVSGVMFTVPADVAME